jgi:hypothetical protein
MGMQMAIIANSSALEIIQIEYIEFYKDNKSKQKI